MLEAKQISGDYRYSDYRYGNDRYQEAPVKKRKTKIKKTGRLQAKLVVVSWVFLAVMTGLMLTATHSQITHKTANINQAKEEISDLQNANERLKLEIDRLKSLDRIEQIATAELGMIQPGINDIEYIAYEKDSEHEEMSAGAAPVEENAATVKVESEQKMHPAILAVNKMIANYVFDMRRSGEKL